MQSLGLPSSLQVIIQARKPDFFEHQGMSLFEIVTEDGLMRPCYTARKGGLCGFLSI